MRIGSAKAEIGETMEIIVKCSDDLRGSKNIYGEPIEEIVRCEDCKYWDFNGLTSWCEAHRRHGLPNNFFCKFGDRRSE